MSEQEDFEHLSPLPAKQVRLKFAGVFQDKKITWDLTLFTLSEYYRQIEPDTAVTDRRQFIYIGELNHRDEVPVRVGLNVPIINKPTIVKTIKMIRQYKRLHKGWHKWGPVITINKD